MHEDDRAAIVGLLEYSGAVLPPKRPAQGPLNGWKIGPCRGHEFVGGQQVRCSQVVTITAQGGAIAATRHETFSGRVYAVATPGPWLYVKVGEELVKVPVERAEVR